MCGEPEKCCKNLSNNRLFLFDFSGIPEVLGGQTIASPSIPPVTDLVIGTPFITANGEGGITSGKAVGVMIGGGIKGTEYLIECIVLTSGGSTVSIYGKLEIH